MKKILNFGFRILDFRSPSSLLPGFLVGAVLAPVGLYADSGLLLSREFYLDLAVPEGGELLNVQTIDYGDATISDVKIGLAMSGDGGPMVNGDWYAGLGYSSGETESGYAVLLNRIGKTAAWPFGSLDDGFDVTFDDDASDIHFSGGSGGGAITGAWSPSGRETLPENVVDTDSRTAMLSSFDGLSGVGEFQLLLSHEATGGAAKLDGWSYEMNVTADPAGTLRLSTGDTVRTAGGAAEVASDVRIDGIVDFAAAGDVSISGSLTGSGTVRQTGAGKLVLSEEGDFSGIVAVTGGNLEVTNQTGSATGSAAVTVSQMGILSGTGRIAGPVSVFGGGSVSPGVAGPGSLTVEDDMTWGEGGIFLWKVADALGAAGEGWDWISIGENLILEGTMENPFLIRIVSLDLFGLPGTLDGFDPLRNYSWTLATAGNFVGFEVGGIEIDASEFFAHNEVDEGGTFSLIRDGADLRMTYSAIPEPRTYALGAGICVLAFAWLRRRIGRGC